MVTRREEGHPGGAAVLPTSQVEPAMVSGGPPADPGEDDQEPSGTRRGPRRR